MSTRLAITRRQFVRLGAAGAVAVAASPVFGAPAAGGGARPNILVVITDQQHAATISARGCPHIHTPALDRLCARGVHFDHSYSAYPLCSPARSAVFSSRMPSETGVYRNGRPIHPSIPNLGQWFRKQTDYETVYTGKWHLPSSFTHNVPGFNVLTAGVGGQGNLGDASTSRACEAFLRNRTGTTPFLLVCSLFQPHDICQWLRLNQVDPGTLRYPQLEPELPPLPPNFELRSPEPAIVASRRDGNEPGVHKGKWSPLHWRYYMWAYYRHVEMVDAEFGRVLRALEETGLDQETLVIFTSDHGEGLAHHQMVRKNFLYDEAARVPLIASWPGHLPGGTRDTRLVSGLDIVPTACHYAGVAPPQRALGTSLHTLFEDDAEASRPFITAEVADNRGRMIRTPRHKYVAYRDEPIEQLFDMQADPGETKNLARSSGHASLLADHRRMLREWEPRLRPAPGVPHAEAWRKA